MDFVFSVVKKWRTPPNTKEPFFIAEYTKKDLLSNGGGVKEEEEDIEVLELSFTDALSMIEHGQIKDAKTIMLLQYAQIHGLFVYA